MSFLRWLGAGCLGLAKKACKQWGMTSEKIYPCLIPLLEEPCDQV